MNSCIYLLLLITVATNGQVSSQDIPPIYSKIRFTLMAGPSILSVRGNESYNQWGVTKFGYSAGFGIIKELTSYLHVQGKILFEKKGYKMSKPDTISTSNGPLFIESSNNYKYDYLTFSIVPQFLIGKRKAISIGTGFYFGSLLRARYQAISSYFNYNYTRKMTDAYSKEDYGLAINLGYSLAVNKKYLIELQLTENYGLKQIGWSSWQQKNNSIVLTVALSKK